MRQINGHWVLCFWVLACVAVPTHANPLVFTSNEGSQSISVIDGVKDEVVTTIQDVGKPRGLTLCAHDPNLYVADQKNEQLLVIDVGTLQVKNRIGLGRSPEGAYCSPDGHWVAVANEESNAISFISTQEAKLLFSVAVKGKNPEHAVFSPDGQWMLVSAEESDRVDLIDLKAKTQVDSIVVGERPRGIAFTPNGEMAYVGVESESMLVVIDMKARKVLQKLKVGNRTNGVLMHPSG